MWILVGITIFSMFTASLTTILQNLTITKVQDLTGKSVRSLFWIFIPKVCLLLGKLKLMNSVSNKCFYDNSSKILIELDPTECIFCVLVVLQEIAFCLDFLLLGVSRSFFQQLFVRTPFMKLLN